MRILLYLVKWHLRRDLWLILPQVLVAVALIVWPALSFESRNLEGVNHLLVFVYLAVAALFTMRLVHSYPHTSADSYWLTRPFSVRSYLWSQYLTLLVVLMLPIFFGFLIHSLWLGGSVLDTFPLLLVLLGAMTAIFGAAVLTKNIFFCAGLVSISCFFIGLTIGAIESLQIFPNRFNGQSFILSLPLCGAIALVIIQTARHHWKRTRLLFVGAGLVVPVCGFFLTSFGKNIQTDVKVDEGLEVSFQSVPDFSKSSGSYYSYTQINFSSEDRFLVPISATIQTGDQYYELTYPLRKIGRGMSPFVDKVLQSFPEETRVSSTSPLYDESKRRPFDSAILSSRGEFRGGASELIVDETSQGKLKGNFYDFVHLNLGRYEEGVSRVKSGYRAHIKSIKKTETGQNVKLVLQKLNDSMFFNREEIFYMLVLYSPSSQKAVTMSPQNFYLRRFHSLVIQGQQEVLSLPDAESIIDTVNDVECHVFICRRSNKIVSKVLSLSPGSYKTSRVRRQKKEEREFEKISDFTEFQEAWIQSFLKEGNHQYNNRANQIKSLLGRSDEEIASLIDHMIEQEIPLSLIRPVLTDGRVAKRFTADFLKKRVMESPVLFEIVRRHPEKKAFVPYAVKLVKSLDRSLPFAVTVIAAESRDASLKAHFADVFRNEEGDLNSLYRQMESLFSREELEEMVGHIWKKAEAGFLSKYRIAKTAARHGHYDALIHLLTRLESVSLGKRVKNQTFRDLLNLVSLSAEQKTWSKEKVVTWLSQSADRFTYNRAEMTWSAK